MSSISVFTYSASDNKLTPSVYVLNEPKSWGRVILNNWKWWAKNTIVIFPQISQDGKWLEVIISKETFISLKIDFVLANGADPVEMPNYPFRGLVTKFKFKFYLRSRSDLS